MIGNGLSYWVRPLFLIVFGISTLMDVRISAAQFTIQFGGDFNNTKRALEAQGYSQIQLVGQGFTKFQVEACKNGTRYWFKADGRGHVNQKQQIGVCQTTIDIDQARQILVNQGYTRINIEDRQGTYSAIACQGDKRVRISVNYLGQLGGRMVLGQCRNTLRPADVAVKLQSEGYTRIHFTHRQLPIYQANACLGKRKFELELNQFGETLSQKPAGRCRGPLNPRRLAKWMRDRGYSQVNVIDNKLPRYIVEGCQNKQRFELTLNRYGDVIERYNAGPCAQPATRKQVIQLMRDQGFSQFFVRVENANGFQIHACHSGIRYDVQFDAYGEYKGDKKIGECKALKLPQISKKIKAAGFKDFKYFVQACKNGKLYRYRVNKFGEIFGGEAVGRCR